MAETLNTWAKYLLIFIYLFPLTARGHIQVLVLGSDSLGYSTVFLSKKELLVFVIRDNGFSV